MYAESYLHNLISKVCPINGLRVITTNDIIRWPNSVIATTADNLIVAVDTQDVATQVQKNDVTPVVNTFNYSTVESARQQLDALDLTVSMRGIIEAFVGDTSINPSYCGGQGGTATQHAAWVHGQKTALRAQLPS